MPGMIALKLVLVPLLVLTIEVWSQAGNTEEHVSQRVLHLCKRNSICAEVGVWKGEFTKHLLARSPRELYLIDPWEYQVQFPGRWFSGKVAHSQSDMDEIADGVAKRYGTYPGVHIVRNKSANAFPTFADGTFDFVYIDGNHEYEPTLQDLRNAWRTVKAGGSITGDDYMWRNDSNFPCVKEAVETFVTEKELRQPEVHQVGGWQFVIKKPRSEA